MIYAIKKYLNLDLSNKVVSNIECSFVDITQKRIFLLKYLNDDIGYLSFENNEWSFIYSDWFKNQNELKPLFEFPDIEKNYKSLELWPFFLNRVPSFKQPKIQKYFENNPSDRNNIVKLLEVFGVSSINNPFKLELNM